MAADSGTDIVALGWLAGKPEAANQVVHERQSTLKTFTKVFKQLKKENPQAYRSAWEQIVSDLNLHS